MEYSYVLDLFRDTRKMICKLASIPIDPNHKLEEAEGDKNTDKEAYQKLVGKLIYLSHTRSDITYAVSIVSQFMYKPKELHLKTIYRILHYLKRT